MLIVEDPACGPCKLFERQVGAIYMRTDESRRLPLRRVPLGTYLEAGVSFSQPIVRAPTFVIVEDRVEQHRFEGYSSDELFWMTLERLRPR
ncbi:hypothetical protein B1810_16790 [Panacagrimonas perspica]|nr:hypothetical protein B1810_16790 [Panacagrimonas perspica]